MLSYDVTLNAFVTLFVTVDPIGNAPLFLGLTIGMSSMDRRMSRFVTRFITPISLRIH